MVDSILQHSKRSAVPVQEAKRWYVQNQRSTRNLNENQITSFSFTPDWDYPQIVPFKDSVDLLMVPVKENLDSIFDNANYQLVFSKDSLNNIQTRLLVLSATDAYYQSHKNDYSTSDFTGLSISIDEEGKIRYPLLINQGHMYNISLDSLYNSYSNQGRGDSPYGCWNGSIGFFGSLYNWVRWTIEHTSLNGGGSGNDGDNFPGNWGWGFFGWPPCGNNPGGSGSGNGNSGWNTNPNGSSGGSGFSLFSNYFTDALFESSQYRDQVKKCKGNYIYSNDVNTPVIFAIDKSTFGFDYKLFVGAYDYYLYQLSQGNTNFQLKDAFAIVQTPPSTYKFFPNPFNLAQWKPKLDPIYQKMKKDFEEHKNCTGSLNTGPDGNSSCDCFEYMVEDVKRDFLRTLGILNNNFTNAQNQEAAEIYAVSYKYLIDELPKLKDDQPDLANPSFELFGRIFNRILSKKIGKVIPFVGSAIDLGSAWSYYQSGNYEAAALNMAIAIVGLIPAEALLEAGADIISICHTSWAAYKPFASLSEFFIAHPQYFENIYKTVDELDFIDKVEWIAINNNVKQFRINEMAPAQVEIFAQKLAENFNKTWDGNYLKIAGDDFLFYKYMDNSFGKWAMHINYYGKAFKIRFGY